MGLHCIPRTAHADGTCLTFKVSRPCLSQFLTNLRFFQNFVWMLWNFWLLLVLDFRDLRYFPPSHLGKKTTSWKKCIGEILTISRSNWISENFTTWCFFRNQNDHDYIQSKAPFQWSSFLSFDYSLDYQSNQTTYRPCLFWFFARNRDCPRQFSGKSNAAEFDRIGTHWNGMPADEIERKRHHDTSQRLFRCSIHKDNQNNCDFKSRLFWWRMECLADNQPDYWDCPFWYTVCVGVKFK